MRVVYVYLLGAITILLSIGFCAGRASAQHQGHAENHDAYKGLSNPTTGVSCCHALTADDPAGDCRPGAVWRDAAGDLRARPSAYRAVIVPSTPAACSRRAQAKDTTALASRRRP